MLPDLEHQPSFNYGYIMMLSTILFFFTNNTRVLSAIVPLSARTNKHQEWKWKNIATSFIHSSITGSGACLLFWLTPEYRKDLITHWTASAHCLIAFSIGYFIYDLVDMMINDRKSKTYELIAHHTLVISCFMLSMTTYRYAGFTLMALLVEVNSIFLHIRQLMIIQCWSRQCLFYRLNCSLNLCTFIVFRIVTMGWMSRWIIENREALSVSAYRLGGLTLAVIMVMNIILLVRILKSDFRQCPKTHLEQENIKAR